MLASFCEQKADISGLSPSPGPDVLTTLADSKCNSLKSLSYYIVARLLECLVLEHVHVCVCYEG